MNIVELISGAYVGGGGGGGKPVFTADTNFYVATTGNDTTGTGAVGSPWATVQKAINTIRSTYDRAGFSALINIADGTYTGNIALTADSGLNNPFIPIGNSTTPANVILTSTSGDTVTTTAGKIVTRYLEVRAAIGSGFASTSFGESRIGIGTRLGACGDYHANSGTGGKVIFESNYSIVGGAKNHMLAWNGGVIQNAGLTVTLTGTPAFSIAFAEASGAGLLGSWGNTWTGAATGKRYAVSSNATIQTYGYGASYFPGNVAGTVDGATGGIFL